MTRILIASSSESLQIARAIQVNLEYDAECTIWNQGLFAPSQYPLESLSDALDRIDFGVFIFAPDDVLINRSETYSTTRDNVVFELGLGIGRLGKERCFVVTPRNENELHMPSDLRGLTFTDYDPNRTDNNLRAAVAPACNQIREAIRCSRNMDQTDYDDPARWTISFPASYPIDKLFLRTAHDSQKDLFERIEASEARFTTFGLTRNFFISAPVRGIIERKAHQIPIKLFMMDPAAESRKDRYRLEPEQAAFEDPNRYERRIVAPFRELLCAVNDSKPKAGAGLQIFFFNFPCSFAIEEIDDACRVMLYGHAKRGTESPIFVFPAGTPYFDYFIGQIRWLEAFVQNGVTEPWKSAGIKVWPLSTSLE